MLDDLDKAEWLTVPQAAKALGIQERQIRRYAARLGEADRRQDTETGRARLQVRYSALCEIAGRSPDDRTQDRTQDRTPPPDDRAEAGQGDRAGQDTPGPPPETGVMPPAAYQRVIAEQAARIDDLKTRLDQADRREIDLLNALQLAQENLHREQSLRLLGVERAEPLETTGHGDRAETGQEDRTRQDTPPEATGDAQAGASEPAGTETAPVTAAPGKPGFWARLWGARQRS